MSLLGSPTDTEEGLMGKQRSPCSADLLVRLCEVCKQRQEVIKLQSVICLESRLQMHQQDDDLTPSGRPPSAGFLHGKLFNLCSATFSPTCDNCRSLWALALLSIHVIVIHNERNTLKASCFPAAALQPATSQLVKKTTSLPSWLVFSEPAHFEKYFLSCRAGLWDITCLYCRAFNLMSLRIESNPGRSLRMTRLLCLGALTQHSVDLPESFCQKALFKTVNFSCICIVCIAHFCDYLCKTAFQSGGETCHLALIWKVCVSDLSSGWIDPLWLTFTVQENKDELREIQVVCLCAPAPEK